MGRLAQALVIALGLAGTQAAHASTSRDVSFRPDPFAAAPKLSQPSIAEQLKALEERANRASACVALCELAASIDAHPLGREVSIHAPIRTEGFTGHYWDKEASLYYAKARYYDPFTARFTQSDSFLGNIDDPPSLHRYFYAHANPTMFVDPTGYAAGDVWDPRTYLGSGEQRAGAWAGFSKGYFENAADVGDSVGAFGKGIGKAGKGLLVGAASLVGKAVELDIKLKTGTFQQKKEALQEGYSMVAGTVDSLADGGRLLAHGVSNPDDVLDAASELGISKTSEALGGATFETALLLSPMAKGAPAGVVVEGRSVTAVRPMAGSQLSLGSRVAREILRPVFRKLGTLDRAVHPGIRLTAIDKTRRFFLQDTASYPGVSYGPTGSFLKARFPQFQWEQHHAFFQRKWIRRGGPSQWYPGDRFAQEGLQRVTDAGWNLMPIPRRLNQALGRSPLGTTLFGGGVAGTGLFGLYTALGSEPSDR